MAVPYSRTVIGSLPWYSVLIVAGILLAVCIASHEEKRIGLPKDTAVDLALVVVPCGIVGARAYYVAMSWQSFVADPLSVLYVWQGGLAIYGGVIGGALGAWIYARRRQLSFAAIADIIAPGLLLAQAVGRWGNYFNMEAYGPAISDPRLQFFPLAVLIPAAEGWVWHAATFFYESMWNLGGFIALWLLRKHQRQRGNVFAWYLVIYGSGRFIIEQLRQDSLMIGPLRASQYLSLLLCAGAALLLLRRSMRGRHLVFSALCVLLWISRWALMGRNGGYAFVLLAAGTLAVWLTRRCPRAHAWLAAALVLDAAGLMMSMSGWPVSHELAAQLHTLLCSITLPMGLGALTCTQDE